MCAGFPAAVSPEDDALEAPQLVLRHVRAVRAIERTSRSAMDAMAGRSSRRAHDVVVEGGARTMRAAFSTSAVSSTTTGGFREPAVMARFWS
jgi:hypothetical protein